MMIGISYTGPWWISCHILCLRPSTTIQTLRANFTLSDIWDERAKQLHCVPKKTSTFYFSNNTVKN